MGIRQVAIDAETACLEDEKIYFFGSKLNMLYYCDLNTKKVYVLGKIPKYELVRQKLIGRILKWRGLIVVAPFNAKEIWIYDIANNAWEEIEIKDANSAGELFYQGFVNGNEIRLIGCGYPAIVTLNMNTRT